MHKIKEILQNLGLEHREIKIYLTLIKNNPQTALQISKQTAIDRTTTYDLLDKMVNKGMISIITKNNSKHFRALTPKKLLEHYKEKYSSLEHILPELNKISQQSQEQVKCEFFQGKNGLKTVLKDLIESKKEYKVIGIKKEYEEILGYFNDQGVLKLNIDKIREKGVYAKGEQFKKLKHGKYKAINQKLSPITTVIYGNKVAFFIWTIPYYSILIENKTFAKGQEEYFNILWKS